MAAWLLADKLPQVDEFISLGSLFEKLSTIFI